MAKYRQCGECGETKDIELRLAEPEAPVEGWVCFCLKCGSEWGVPWTGTDEEKDIASRMTYIDFMETNDR